VDAGLLDASEISLVEKSRFLLILCLHLAGMVMAGVSGYELFALNFSSGFLGPVMGILFSLVFSLFSLQAYSTFRYPFQQIQEKIISEPLPPQSENPAAGPAVFLEKLKHYFQVNAVKNTNSGSIARLLFLSVFYLFLSIPLVLLVFEKGLEARVEQHKQTLIEDFKLREEQRFVQAGADFKSKVEVYESKVKAMELAELALQDSLKSAEMGESLRQGMAILLETRIHEREDFIRNSSRELQHWQEELQFLRGQMQERLVRHEKVAKASRYFIFRIEYLFSKKTAIVLLCFLSFFAVFLSPMYLRSGMIGAYLQAGTCLFAYDKLAFELEKAEIQRNYQDCKAAYRQLFQTFFQDRGLPQKTVELSSHYPDPPFPFGKKLDDSPIEKGTFYESLI
jgi:hypothetical protein